MIDVCVKITLGANVLRFSNLGMSRTDGATLYHFDARIKTPVLTFDLGRQDQAMSLPATMLLEISNHDGVMNPYLPGGALYSSDDWMTARIDVYTGPNTTLATMLHEFAGTVPVGGISWGPQYVTLSCNDIRELHNVTISPHVITSLEYPNAPASSIGKSFPEVVGDFTNLNSTNALPAFEFDTTIHAFSPTNWPFDAASLVTYRDGVAFTPAAVSGGPINIYFTVGAGDYSATSVYTAKFIGFPAAMGGPSSWHPVDVVEWALLGNGVPIGDIDTASFATAKAEGDAMQVRRYIDAQTTSFAEINALCFQCGYDLFVNRSGQYEIRWFAPVVSSPVELTERNIISGTIQTTIDPDQIYANGLTANIDYRAGASNDKAYVNAAATFGMTINSKSVERTYDFTWVYVVADALLQLQRKLFFWVRMPEVVTIGANYGDQSDPVYSVFLEDSVRITLYRFAGADAWIRRSEVDLLSGNISFRAVQMDSMPTIGVWDDGTQARPGYWGDVAGVPYDSYWW